MRVEIRDDSGQIVVSYVTSTSRHFGKVENLSPGRCSEDRDKCVAALVETLRTLGVDIIR